MQSEFQFENCPTATDGLAAWREGRARQLSEVARANGLPLGYRCRVELMGGVVIEGHLRLAEDCLPLETPQRDLNLRLQVERCQFTPLEIISVIRLDP